MTEGFSSASRCPTFSSPIAARISRRPGALPRASSARDSASGGTRALDAGEAFDHVTEKALEQARLVVVLWSTHSVESRWVRAEATQADRSKKLVPVEIEPCKRPIMFELTQTADLSRWKGDPGDENWRALVGGLRRQLDKGDLAAPAQSPVASTRVPATGASRRFRGLGIGVAALLLAGVVGFALIRWGGNSTPQPATSDIPTSRQRARRRPRR